MRILAILGLGAIAACSAGCGSLSGPGQEYTSPTVTGRVINARTGQPVVGAVVSRPGGDSEKWDAFPKATGEAMKDPTPAVTDAGGHFTLPAIRAVYLIFTPSTSLSQPLLVNQWDYITLRTNIDLVKLRPVKGNGPPLVNVGDLPLRPKE